MDNFNFYSPTEFVFGKDRENECGNYVKKYDGKKVLIHYGGGSVIRSGLLDRVKNSLDSCGIEYVELGGVKPNPRDTKIYEGIELCRKENVDFILSVGGGSCIDSAKGIAIGAGMKVIEVPGADGTLHTNYVGKAQAAVDALTKDGYDFAYVHVEAPDEMGHQGSLPNKLEAIESLDSKVIRTVVEGMKAAGEEFRLLVMPDHPTPIRCRTHTSDPVPFLLYDSTKERRRIGFYNEEEAKASGILYPEGYKLIDTLFEK